MIWANLLAPLNKYYSAVQYLHNQNSDLLSNFFCRRIPQRVSFRSLDCMSHDYQQLISLSTPSRWHSILLYHLHETYRISAALFHPPQVASAVSLVWAGVVWGIGSTRGYTPLDGNCHHPKHTVVKSTSQSRCIQDSLFSLFRQHLNYIHRYSIHLPFPTH